jgi:dTDP-4-dehydrorhamnose reductase
MNAQDPKRGAPELWGGAECTINRLGDRFFDQSERSGHNRRAEDLDRLASLGIKALRYPLLWETFAAASDPERLWAWHDARLERLRAVGVRPIVGLVHHGSGPLGKDLLRDAFVEGVAAHAAAAAARHPWIADWTPINEPLTTARFCALYGHWHPHAREEGAFWLALLNQIDATRAAMAEVRAANPAARLIQTEDLGRTFSTPERAAQATFDNHRRWATWDLLSGRLTPRHPLWTRICGFGFESRLEAIARAPCPPDLIGVNHYLTSDRFLDHDLSAHPADTHGDSGAGPLADVAAVRVHPDAPGLEGALREVLARYDAPVAITEVHNGCTREEQMRWLLEAWEIARRLRAEGAPIAAVTAWSLLGSFDWNSLLTRNAGHYEPGALDVRGPTPRGTALAPMLRTIAAGKTPSHPVLDVGGWWRGHARREGAGRTRPLLIVGATGTLGRAFAAACVARGIAHVSTGRAEMDLRDLGAIDRTLDDLQPWAVINCAGWVRVDAAETDAAACLAANHLGSVALAAACARRDIHCTGFSSDLVFDGAASRPYVESDAPAPLSVYGLSKARADADMLSGDGRTLVVRTASFFSPNDPYNFAMRLVEALRGRRAFQVAGDCVTSPTYVPDLVDAALDLVIDDETGLWHLASGGALSWSDFALELSDATRLPGELIETRPAHAMGWTAPRPRHAPITSERGLIMPKLETAIARFAAAIG